MDRLVGVESSTRTRACWRARDGLSSFGGVKRPGRIRAGGGMQKGNNPHCPTNQEGSTRATWMFELANPDMVLGTSARYDATTLGMYKMLHCYMHTV
jgi:hypothetical protein